LAVVDDGCCFGFGLCCKPSAVGPFRPCRCPPALRESFDESRLQFVCTAQRVGSTGPLKHDSCGRFWGQLNKRGGQINERLSCTGVVQMMIHSYQIRITERILSEAGSSLGPGFAGVGLASETAEPAEEGAKIFSPSPFNEPTDSDRTQPAMPPGIGGVWCKICLRLLAAEGGSFLHPKTEPRWEPPPNGQARRLQATVRTQQQLLASFRAAQTRNHITCAVETGMHMA
jgi:hypothetical protein